MRNHKPARATLCCFCLHVQGTLTFGPNETDKEVAIKVGPAHCALNNTACFTGLKGLVHA